ncbi:MAG TPA: hypothetical protein HA230_04325 [Candidatus Aenigmarchaeota archaeon]|nr:hypothetical protein [Candidatus Aenigmarchaeota archaeon]
MYTLGKRGVSSILGLNEELYPEVKEASNLGRYAILGVLGLAAIGAAACKGPPPDTYVVAEKRVIKGLQKPGSYTGDNRQDALILTSCGRSVGCEDHTYFGLPTVVEETYRRVAKGDTVSVPMVEDADGNDVSSTNVAALRLLTPSPIGDTPSEIDLDVREVVIDAYENPLTLDRTGGRVTIKAVQRIRGLSDDGTPTVDEKVYFLRPIDLSLEEGRKLRDGTNYHTTLTLFENTGNGKRILRSPGTITGVGADQHFDSVIELPRGSYAFTYREKTEVLTPRNDVREGRVTGKGVYIGKFKEAPCGPHDDTRYACKQPEPPAAKPVPKPKPAPKPKNTPQKTCPKGCK